MIQQHGWISESLCRPKDKNTEVHIVRFHLYKKNLIYSDRNRSIFLAAGVRRELWTTKDYEESFEEDGKVCILMVYGCNSGQKNLL